MPKTKSKSPIKESQIHIKCLETFKEKVKKQTQSKGFGSVSTYIRYLINKDLKDNEK
jgi:Arc/MetJ-type ribon-helix-helix transcriptional regulator